MNQMWIEPKTRQIMAIYENDGNEAYYTGTVWQELGYIPILYGNELRKKVSRNHKVVEVVDFLDFQYAIAVEPSLNPVQPPQVVTETDKLREKVDALEARLAKLEGIKGDSGVRPLDSDSIPTDTQIHT